MNKGDKVRITFSGTIEIKNNEQSSIDDYSKWLRVSRVTKGLTMVELSNLSGVSPSHISRIERGERVPGGRVLGKLRKILNSGNL